MHRFYPASRAQSPLIAGFEAAKLPLGVWCAQIVAATLAEFQEVFGHDGANDMGTDIFFVGFAATIAKKARHRIKRAGHQRLAKDISCWENFCVHCNSIKRRPDSSAKYSTENCQRSVFERSNKKVRFLNTTNLSLAGLSCSIVYAAFC